MTPEQALEVAVKVALLSPCSKSKRGVVIFRRTLEAVDEFPIARAYNGPPRGFACDGSAACAGACNRVAVHAEERALVVAGASSSSVVGAELVHVKVQNGVRVASGEPSCWQCSRTVLEAGISGVWLLRPSGLCYYPAYAFHRITLQANGLPVIEAG